MSHHLQWHLPCSIEGGLHVEVLRDWSFEARAYLPGAQFLTSCLSKG